MKQTWCWTFRETKYQPTFKENAFEKSAFYRNILVNVKWLLLKIILRKSQQQDYVFQSRSHFKIDFHFLVNSLKNKQRRTIVMNFLNWNEDVSYLELYIWIETVNDCCISDIKSSFIISNKHALQTIT